MDGISSTALDPVLAPVTPQPPAERGEGAPPPEEPEAKAPESGSEVDTYA
jgi:hypothetical protein